MNQSVLIARRRALRVGLSINDGNGIASPDSVFAVRRVTAVTHSPNSGEQQ